MPNTFTAPFTRAINSVNTPEPYIHLLQIDHDNLADPVRVCRDNQDWPYGASYEWSAGMSVTVGQKIIPWSEQPGQGFNGFYYESQDAGTLHAIDQPGWPVTIGGTVVSNGVTLECVGYQYKALPFDVTRPSQPEQGQGTATLSLSNIGKELVGWIETTNGGEGATATVSLALRSQPGVIENPVTVDMKNVSISLKRVSAQLGYFNYRNLPAVSFRYDTERAPGIF